MSVNRTLLTRTTGKVTFGGGTFHHRGPIRAEYAPTLDDVIASLHGRINATKRDFLVRATVPLFGLWENLSVLFPSGLLTPVPGASLCSDASLVIHGRSGARLTFHNAFISKMPNLYFGIDAEIFAAEVEFTALIKSSANPEDAGAYYTRDSAAFSDTTFATTNFRKQRYTLAWGSTTGFTSFEMHKGINLSWEQDVQFDQDANYGTVNAYLGADGVRATVTGIPMGPTQAQIDAVGQGQGRAGGVLVSGLPASAADLVITGSSVTVTAKNAVLVSHGDVFDITELQQAPISFITTTGFTTGTPAAIGVVA